MKYVRVFRGTVAVRSLLNLSFTVVIVHKSIFCNLSVFIDIFVNSQRGMILLRYNKNVEI